jgi:hypothetical protein
VIVLAESSSSILYEIIDLLEGKELTLHEPSDCKYFSLPPQLLHLVLILLAILYLYYWIGVVLQITVSNVAFISIAAAMELRYP